MAGARRGNDVGDQVGYRGVRRLNIHCGEVYILSFCDKCEIWSDEEVMMETEDGEQNRNR
jgi:hypothetical protein